MNKPTPNVRKQTPPRQAKTDRRVLRTRRALGSALVELMLKRKFDDINVQQILDRANVGRATFYAHCSNKSDLLLSDADRLSQALGDRFLQGETDSRRVAPVLELFSHVANFHEFQSSLDEAGLQESKAGIVTDHLARMIERRVAILHPKESADALSRSVMSRVFAGALVELLLWWIGRAERPSAKEMDDQFHEIVWGGLGRVT